MHRQRHAFSHSRSLSRAHAPTKYIWVSRVAKHYLFEALFCFSNINTGTHSLTHSLTISAIVGITMCESTREWERARHEPPSNGTFFFRFCLLFFVIFTSVRCVCVCVSWKLALIFEIVIPMNYVWNVEKKIYWRKKKKRRIVGSGGGQTEADFIIQPPLTHSSTFFLSVCAVYSFQILSFITGYRICEYKHGVFRKRNACASCINQNESIFFLCVSRFNH